MTDAELTQYHNAAQSFADSAAASDIILDQKAIVVIVGEIKKLGLSQLNESAYHAACYSARSQGLLTLRPAPAVVVQEPPPAVEPEPERKVYRGSAIEILEQAGVKPCVRTSVSELLAEQAKKDERLRVERQAKQTEANRIAADRKQEADEAVTIFRRDGRIDHALTQTARLEAKARSKRK